MLLNILNSNPIIFRFSYRNLTNKLEPIFFSTLFATKRHSQSKMQNNTTSRNETTSGDVETLGKVYVQCNSDKEMMTISFQYLGDGKSKYFNLQRKVTEPLSSSLERIKLNLTKIAKPRKSKKKNDQATQDLSYQVDLSLNGSMFDPDSTKNIDAWVEGAIMELNGKPYQVRTNDPQVESMKLPSCIMEGFITMPSLNLVNCIVDECKFSWYRQISSDERDEIARSPDFDDARIEFSGRYWYKLSEGFTYSPSQEDIAHYIKVVCHPSDGTKEGPISESISSGPVELGPVKCPFEKRHAFTNDTISCQKEFRFLTYNILANLYADSDYSRTVLFKQCPSYALEIDYRRQLLLKEIHGYNADLICLQEVDKMEFFRTYQPFFKIVNDYSGILHLKGGQVAEGCATFFRNDKFELIDSHKTQLSDFIETVAPISEQDTMLEPQNVEQGCEKEEVNHSSHHPILADRGCPAAKECLSKFDFIRSVILSNENLKKRFFERKTIIQTSLLKVKNLTSNYIIVANTHLYFAPDADHIRLLQGSVCLKYLDFLKDYYKNMLSNEQASLNVVFCGDMNSTPDCGLYKLATGGKVSEDLPDWLSNKEEAVIGLNVETNLRFFSAYENIPYTNYTPDFQGCLDYIYYEKDGITCESTVPLPDHEDVIAVGGIPSDVFPSDHLALIANFKLSN